MGNPADQDKLLLMANWFRRFCYEDNKTDLMCVGASELIRRYNDVMDYAVKWPFNNLRFLNERIDEIPARYSWSIKKAQQEAIKVPRNILD